jgi:hypothetical protein
MFTKEFALGNVLQYLQITITLCDTLNLIRPLHVFEKTENWQIKKELDIKKTQLHLHTICFYDTQ